jgi:DNA-directed RNA polymerase subunit RPC12/RpoP
MAKVLSYKCKTCGEVNASPIQVNEVSFNDPSNQLTNNTYQCRSCGSSNPYNKEDHFFVEQ